MKPVVKAMQKALKLVRHSPKIYFLYVLFLVLRWLVTANYSFWLLDIIFLGSAVGWTGARYVLIKQTLSSNRTIDLKTLPKLLWQSFKILFPLILLSLGILLFPLVILVLWYGKWFADLYLNSGAGLSSSEVWQNFLPAIFNADIWREFINQNWFMRFMYQFFLLAVIVGLLTVKLIIIFLIVEGSKFKQSIAQALYFLSWHLPLVGGFVILQIINNLVLQALNTILVASMYEFQPVLAAWGFMLVQALLLLIMDSFVMAYFLKHHPIVTSVNGLRHLWRRNHSPRSKSRK